jgi:hypothetical protein
LDDLKYFCENRLAADGFWLAAGVARGQTGRIPLNNFLQQKQMLN